MFFKKSAPDKARVLRILQEYTLDGKPVAKDAKAHLDGAVLQVKLYLTSKEEAERAHAELSERLLLEGVERVDLEAVLPKASPPQTRLQAHPRIRHILAVASGKGGVGKSTTTVNLALALKARGHKVGVLDADIYGPSVPDMLGVAGQKPKVEAGKFVPLDAYGMPVMSIGSLLDGEATPVAWRGIKATGALMQLYQDTLFGHLDYLLIDMPPGTGDIALTLAQRIPITAAVIVTTPQHIALLDVKKGIELFAKTAIPVMGVIENMALHTCQKCGHTEAIFGEDGAQTIAQMYNVPLLGQLPLARAIGEQVNKGVPSVQAGDEFAVHYRAIAAAVDKDVDRFAKTRHDKRIF